MTPAATSMPSAAIKLKPNSIWLPSFCDCFLVAVLVWLFLAGASGWKSLLMDGDTGWHIRTGEYILDHHRIPANDLYSYSKPGAPWYAWEWLSDVGFAVLFRLAGLKGVVLGAGTLVALYATILLRFAIWRGANVMLALPLALVAVGSSSMHFLARPHLVTLVLLPLSIWVVERDRERPDNWVWLLIPVTVVWTNLHGGFAIFLVLLVLLTAATALSVLWKDAEWSMVRRYGALFVGCLLATLCNPFGLSLHRHMIEYLRADWIKNLVQEFQAPTFRSEGQFQFEALLLLGVMVAARLLARRQFVETAWILSLAHAALTSVRHAPLFAAVALPFVARELTDVWLGMTRSMPASSVSQILFSIGQDILPAFRRVTVWSAAAICIVASVDAPIAWPHHFPAEAFPIDLVENNASAIQAASRIFTTDQWGDFLIFKFQGSRKVFIDGRSDFYGEALGRDYLALLQGSIRADKLMEKYKFDLVLVPVEWPLATFLKHDNHWRVAADDGRAILLRQRALPLSDLAKKPASSLMNKRLVAELSSRTGGR